MSSQQGIPSCLGKSLCRDMRCNALQGTCVSQIDAEPRAWDRHLTPSCVHRAQSWVFNPGFLSKGIDLFGQFNLNTVLILVITVCCPKTNIGAELLSLIVVLEWMYPETLCFGTSLEWAQVIWLFLGRGEEISTHLREGTDEGSKKWFHVCIPALWVYRNLGTAQLEGHSTEEHLITQHLPIAYIV